MNEPLTARELDIIRGRASVQEADNEDVDALIEHIDALQELLDEGDQDDCFGTEGWRHRLGIE